MSKSSEGGTAMTDELKLEPCPKCKAARHMILVNRAMRNPQIECWACDYTLEGEYDDDGGIKTLRAAWNERPRNDME